MNKRKRFTIEELALYFGVHRNTMSKRLKGVDLRDPSSMIEFLQNESITLMVGKLNLKEEQKQ